MEGRQKTAMEMVTAIGESVKSHDTTVALSKATQLVALLANAVNDEVLEYRSGWESPDRLQDRWCD